MKKFTALAVVFVMTLIIISFTFATPSTKDTGQPAAAINIEVMTAANPGTTGTTIMKTPRTEPAEDSTKKDRPPSAMEATPYVLTRPAVSASYSS